MLSNQDVIPQLLEAVPALESVWSEIEDDDYHFNDDGTRLNYIDAGSIARMLVAMYQDGRTDELRSAFVVFERFLLDGYPETAELITVGYLEDIQNASLQSGIPLDDWLLLMGPECRRWWLGVQIFWEEGRVHIQPVDSDGTTLATSSNWISALVRRWRA